MPTTEKLFAGYWRFLDGYYKQYKEQLFKLALEGQSPKIALFSCCDARVEPSIILDCEPCDLFAIRNPANLVPHCQSDDGLHETSAALEFAVKVLKVESIIVLGHTQCGSTKAPMDMRLYSTPASFIDQLMKQLEYARDNILDEDLVVVNDLQYRDCEQQAISRSLKYLLTFPWISSPVNEGKLRIHGWYYDLARAELFAFQNDSEIFLKIN